MFETCVLIFVLPVSTGPGGQTIRVASPGTTILKAAPQSAGGQQAGQAQVASQQTPQTPQTPGQQAGGKQIITVHKGGQVANQPQIVTLVKTTQGMTVAQVSSACCMDARDFLLLWNTL